LTSVHNEETLPEKGEKGFQPVLASFEANIKPDYHETKAAAQTAKKVGINQSISQVLISFFFFFYCLCMFIC